MKFTYNSTYNAFRRYCEYENCKIEMDSIEDLNKKLNENFKMIYETQPRIILDNSYEYLIEEVISYKGYLLFIIGNQTTKLLYNYAIDDKECEVLGKDLKDRVKDKMYKVEDYKVGDCMVCEINDTGLTESREIPIINTFDMFVDYCNANKLVLSKGVNEIICNSFIRALHGKIEIERSRASYIYNRKSYYFEYLNLNNDLVIIQHHILLEDYQI